MAKPDCTKPLPATAGQAGIFFAEQSKPTGCAYSAAMVADVHQTLDPPRLAAACHRLATATPALRLRFGIDDSTGEVIQWFENEDLELEWHEAPGASRDEVTRLIDRITARPFEIDEGPMTRFAIVVTDERRASIAIVSHHLTLDGVSYLRLARRLCESIEGGLEPDAEMGYADLVGRVLDAQGDGVLRSAAGRSGAAHR